MKREDNYSINIPMEFKVACMIYKISVQQVLQVFINLVTFYDTVTHEYMEGYTEASNIVSIYARDHNGQSNQHPAFKNCKRTTVICMTRIMKLAESGNGNSEDKRKKASRYVNQLFSAMEKVHTVADTLYLDENTTLNLTKDFRVICEIHSCYPKQYLEYFMNHVSIADAHARSGLNIPNHNRIVQLFHKIGNGLGWEGANWCNLSDAEVDLLEKMGEMGLSLRIVRKLDERTKILREFYLSHYFNINP